MSHQEQVDYWERYWVQQYGKGANPVCSSYEDPFEFPHCGCRKCGHSKGDHDERRNTR